MSDDRRSSEPGDPTPPPTGAAPDAEPRSVWDDPELFGDGGEELLEQLRTLDEPIRSERVGANLRASVIRRSRRLLRADGLLDHLHLGFHATLLTARRSRSFRLVLLLLLLSVGVLVGREIYLGVLGLRPSGQTLTERARGGAPLPATRQLLAQPEPLSEEQRQAWLQSENELSRLRQLFDERATPEYLQRLRQMAGVDVRVARRIEYLSGGVAEALTARLDEGGELVVAPGASEGAAPFDLDYDSVEEFSLGLRALLAAGAMLPESPHRELAIRVLARLEQMLPYLAQPERSAAFASALTGYLEGVLQTGGGERIRILSRYLARLCALEKELQARRDQGGSPHGESPALPITHWASPLSAIVDAGLLLRVAPALGVSPEDCATLRQRMVQHLELRAEQGPRLRAAAQAAQLFAFSDLVDREALESRLMGYRLYPDRLASDVRSLRYLAWSTSPKGYGFARVNQALRHFVANHEPRTLVERSSLLLVQLFYVAPYFD